jgi:hypothetical protein
VLFAWLSLRASDSNGRTSLSIMVWRNIPQKKRVHVNTQNLQD